MEKLWSRDGLSELCFFFKLFIYLLGLPCSSNSKESACNAGDQRSIPGLGRSSGEGNGNSLQSVFLPGEFHGQRSLVGYSSWGRKELDTTEQLTHTYTFIYYWSIVALQCFVKFLQYSEVNQPYIYLHPLFLRFPSYLGHHIALSRVS